LLVGLLKTGSHYIIKNKSSDYFTFDFAHLDFPAKYGRPRGTEKAKTKHISKIPIKLDKKLTLAL